MLGRRTEDSLSIADGLARLVATVANAGEDDDENDSAEADGSDEEGLKVERTGKPPGFGGCASLGEDSLDLVGLAGLVLLAVEALVVLDALLAGRVGVDCARVVR